MWNVEIGLYEREKIYWVISPHATHPSTPCKKKPQTTTNKQKTTNQTKIHKKYPNQNPKKHHNNKKTKPPKKLINWDSGLNDLYSD